MIDIVILAAGKGTRMKSALPKVLHKLAGRSLLQHVIDTSSQLPEAAITVVTGHGSEQVRESIANPVNWAEQTEQLGTAHAVEQALPSLADDSVALILYGDVPLLELQTLEKMVGLVAEKSMTLLTVELADATGYGRIVRDAEGHVSAIVEHKDASDAQREICEINTGVMALNSDDLKRWLPQIGNDNAQGEFYLTDLIEIARNDGYQVEPLQPATEQEVQGINDRVQLAELECHYQHCQAEVAMRNGATLADPARFDVRGELTVGNDVFIDVNCVFEGKVQLGNNVTIGPNCILTNATIADGAEIKANTVIEDTHVGINAIIGPFARLRPGTVMADNTKVGNFVETKKAVVGSGSKINHLSYVGDAVLGADVNVGAGTITCNYDSANKSLTEIEDGAFIGSNTALVAPVKVGPGATVGAGSVITNEVPGEQLAVARGRQRNIEGWKRPVKK
ncbi:bifunctional UDP-N-acetylglucosamine diphosphorylase/glucosamine-1-phosphate N-acetyltransferase GlmU [Porticoccus sp. W117]|uniref:bifunctional UDP-N-acetylglucosamine diphosphorylase/glucosamine-1-phosphate N-acetyltransferase GlmU n=1 Tax=Porticoccus sp. W117 TaxID=3054777 RepID=UPI002592C0DB|nr:bifunctional UDP-N-acetylglucosamine diphosphorylase/glucosamine-1-phosphate N-acetyltransferase GlmU [Porticoccus sp. W117]MDM3870795.1 bifunctional UDP-N-acetylglucosamine diphosphorylase/glucosamine-1-phosphate N-acetyltransferase GlmU [Porticoccus sp. W117]